MNKQVKLTLSYTPDSVYLSEGFEESSFMAEITDLESVNRAREYLKENPAARSVRLRANDVILTTALDEALDAEEGEDGSGWDTGLEHLDVFDNCMYLQLSNKYNADLDLEFTVHE